jgi:hypothetical protein
MMDVLKTLAEKAFWGHEFLTWLWHAAEEGGGAIPVEGIGPVSLWIENRMVLGSLETESKENILKNGDVSRSGEAAAALKVGKKLQEARFGLTREDREWAFTLKGDTFDLKGVRVPTVILEEGDDLHATILVRLAYVRELTDVLDALFAQFARQRISRGWEAAVVPSIVQWIESKEGG